MSIFKRNEPAVQPASAATATTEVASGGRGEQQASLMPPFVAPGVVPPPAAPIYSMRPPESARTTTQETVQERLRVAVQRAGTAVSVEGVRRRAVPPAPRAPARQLPTGSRQSFDPIRCAQAGLLNLAWSWQEAGSPIRAIHTYVQVLTRYPDTHAAAAAVADLVELSDKLADQGQFHTALVIYEHLERLA
jgi:hypothetical protein